MAPTYAVPGLLRLPIDQRHAEMLISIFDEFSLTVQ